MTTQSHTAMSSGLGNDRGYTLYELLIAIQLMMLVLGIATWGYTQITKTLHIWQTNTTLQMEQIRLERALQNTLNRVHIIRQAEEHLLSGQTSDDSEIRIKHEGNDLLINIKSIPKVNSLRIRYTLRRQQEVVELSRVPDPWLRFIRAVQIEITPAFENSDTIRIFRRMNWGQARSEE